MGNRGADTRIGKALETPPPLAVFNIYPRFQTFISQKHINHTYSGTILPSFLLTYTTSNRVAKQLFNITAYSVQHLSTFPNLNLQDQTDQTYSDSIVYSIVTMFLHTSNFQQGWLNQLLNHTAAD